MKQVIRGRRYDTDTATNVGSASYSGSVRDFQWWHEELYLKRTGEFFIFGEGGPASKYAIPEGQNCWGGGKKLVPITLDEAKNWAEKHLDVDEYEALFGIVDECDEKKTVTFSLPLDVIDMIKKGAAESEVSMSDYVEHIIRAR